MATDIIGEIKGLVKAKLSEEEWAEVSEEMVTRFYKATGKSRDLTVKRLVTTAKWRSKEHPECRTCQACSKNIGAHWMHTVGHDKLGRPVIFTSYIMIEDSSAANTTEHMLVEFERATRLMQPGVESWVWIMDFQGFGRRLGDLNPALAKNFLNLSADHYPERLGQLWVVDAPMIMNPLWSMLKPMIDPVTHAKFKFLPWDIKEDGPLPPYVTPTPDEQHDGHGSAVPGTSAGNGADAERVSATNSTTRVSKVWKEFCTLFDEDLAKWLAEEIRHVRAWDDIVEDDEGGTWPKYDVQLLYRAIKEGDLELLPKSELGHCHYGSPKFLEYLKQHPDKLPPHKDSTIV